MPFNINNFRANGLALQGARPSLFEVEIPLLPFATSSNIQDRIKFFITSTSIPADIIEQIEVPYFGRRIKVFGDRVFQDWQVTVMNDEDFPVRQIMERWHNDINAIISNRMAESAFPANYKQRATVKQYGKTGNIIRSYTFEGLFPTQVSPIELNWAAGNEIEYFQVVFAYDYWIPEDQSSASILIEPSMDGDGSISNRGSIEGAF